MNNVIPETIKKEDREILEEVFSYIKKYGGKTEIGGSALECADYRDVDVLVTGDLEILAGIIGGIKGIASYRKGKKIEPLNKFVSKKYSIEDLNLMSYLQMYSVYRIKLLFEDGPTIDLSFNV